MDNIRHLLSQAIEQQRIAVSNGDTEEIKLASSMVELRLSELSHAQIREIEEKGTARPLLDGDMSNVLNRLSRLRELRKRISDKVGEPTVEETP